MEKEGNMVEEEDENSNIRREWEERECEGKK